MDTILCHDIVLYINEMLHKMYMYDVCKEIKLHTWEKSWDDYKWLKNGAEMFFSNDLDVLYSVEPTYGNICMSQKCPIDPSKRRVLMFSDYFIDDEENDTMVVDCTFRDFNVESINRFNIASCKYQIFTDEYILHATALIFQDCNGHPITFEGTKINKKLNDWPYEIMTIRHDIWKIIENVSAEEEFRIHTA